MVASLILASTSERRINLLNQIGINPSKIISPEINESSFENKNPTKLVLELAFEKAMAVKKKRNKKQKILYNCWRYNCLQGKKILQQN